MEPTKEMTPSEREESEQDSYSMNFDPSQYCFEGEEFPALKIIKVETLDSDEVSQNIPYLSFLFDTLIIPIQMLLEHAIKSEVIENDIKLENIEEEEMNA